MIVISLTSARKLSKEISKHLNATLIIPKTQKYSFDEIDISIDSKTNQKKLNNSNSIIIVGSITSSNVLIELLLIIEILKNTNVKHIVAVIPYMCYSRQDKTITSFLEYKLTGLSLISKLLSEINLLITVDIHSKKSLDFFKIPTINIETTDIFANHILKQNHILKKGYDKNSIIVSPDNGSFERATALSNKLQLDVALIDKNRAFNNIEMKLLTNNVTNKNCIIVDDIIDSGNTLLYASKLLKEHGANSVSAYITHHLHSSNTKLLKALNFFKGLHVTNSIEDHQELDTLSLCDDIVRAIPQYCR